MKCLLRVVILIALATTCIADSIVYVRVHRPLIEEHIKLAREGEADRVRTLRGLFDKAGCRQVVEQAVPKEESPNLICLLPGDEEGTIVVSASLDYAPEDAATPARWGALALLPLMAESLSSVPHRFTLMFVAFTGHEHGMRGANWYVSQLNEVQRKTIRAMVDLDSLGKTPPVYALGQPDKALATWLQVAAHSLQLATPALVDPSTADLPLLNGIPASRNEDLWANAKPFVHEGVPAITVQSAMPAMLPALRQQGAVADNVTGAAFDMDAYENTYRLLCVYTLYLDRNLGRPLVEPGTYSGQIIDTAGVFPTSPIDLSVRIDRFTTQGELNRYELILREGGQKGLADALANQNDKGTFRFGLNLAYAVKLIVLQDSGKAPYVLMVGNRHIVGSGTALDYRFTAIKLNLDSKGAGEGSYYSTVKLRFNRKHELEISEFGSKPDLIRQVRLEQPSLPRTIPATAVAAATGPANVPAAVNVPATAAQPASANTSANMAAPPPAAAQTASQAGPASPSATGSTVASANTPPGVSTPKPSSATQEGSVATFHAEAQLVQLDVSVTDSAGRPITGLQQSDFTVLEEGKPQVIRAFESHLPNTVQAAKSAAPPKPSLPPNTFTNLVAAPPEGPLSILLLDLWNTPVPDQAYARKQTIEFLKTLPPGKTVAMYVLGSKLVLVQAFSDDRATLVASAEKVMNERSLLLRTDAERQQFQGAADDVGRMATPTIPAGAPASASANLNSGSLDLGHAQARQRTNAMMEADRAAQRVFATLDALSALARSVSSYPGRKNLIWLSGSFPIRLNPSSASLMQLNAGSFAPTSGLETAPNFPAALRVTTRALATARIAVYPIDVRGVQISGVDLSLGAGASATFAGTGNPQAFGQNLNTQSATRFEERSSMKEVAEQTGGEVLAGNDVRASMGRAMEDGSTYYAIAYTPARSDKSHEFRKIEVKVNRTGLKLAYRPGYFPSGGPEGEPPKTHPLIVAMQPGVPPSTVVPLTVVVLPPDATNKKTRITYTIDIRGMEFADTPEHRKRAVIDCIAVAFTKQGAPVGQISNTMDTTLPMSDYESALRNGLVVPQELELPPGDYILRLGVMDHGSQKIGTLDAPLTVAAVAAAK